MYVFKYFLKTRSYFKKRLKSSERCRNEVEVFENLQKIAVFHSIKTTHSRNLILVSFIRKFGWLEVLLKPFFC